MTGLPEFDAEDSIWADLLWSAAHRRDERSIGALAAHCRRRDAEPVLRWLEDGPGAYRWLAGRLLVEGVPAHEEHTAAFVASLAHSLRGDLTMTHLAAADFLQLAARTRIPAVRELLLAAVQDAEWDWPWSLGPAIATALIRHDPATVTRIAGDIIADPDAEDCARLSAAAVMAKADARHLTAAVDVVRATADGENRWKALEILVDLVPRLNDDVVGEIAEMVREVIRTSGPLPSTHVGAARLLIRLGPRYAAEAVGLLRRLPSGVDDDEEGVGRVEAASGLLEVDPPHTDEAIALLREVLADQYANRLDQLNAATALRALGPRYEDEAVEAVRAVVSWSPQKPSVLRVAAAKTLAGLGRRHRAEAAGILRAVLAGPARSEADVQAEFSVMARAYLTDVTFRSDTGAAAELAALAPPYTAEAVEILRNIIEGHGRPVDADRAVSAAWVLAGVGPQHVDAATGALRRVLARPALDPYTRVRIAQGLPELDQRHADDITAALRAVAAEPGTAEPSQLTDRLRELARDHPQYIADVADTLGAVLHTAVTRQTPAERGPILGAVGDLVELSAGNPAGAAAVLRAVIANPADAWEQIRAAGTLAELVPETVADVIEMLGSLVTDPGAGWQALSELKKLGRDHRGRVVAALRRLLATPRLDAYTRINAVLNLAELDHRHDDDITAALQAVATHPDTDSCHILMSQLKDLACDRPRHTNTVAAALLALTRTATDPSTRVHGASILPRLAPQHTGDAADVLRAVLAAPTIAPPSVIRAATALAALGPEYVPEALQALGTAATDPEATAHDRYLATSKIKELNWSS